MLKRKRLILSVLIAVGLVLALAVWWAGRSPEWARTDVAESGRVSVDEVTQPSVPSGESILDAHARALGAAEALAAVQSRRIETTTQLSLGGLKFDSTRFDTRPNRVYSLTRSFLFGEIRSGSDGQTLWEINPRGGGAKVFEGAERDFRIEDHSFDPHTSWRQRFSEARCTGEMSIDGEPCWMVSLTPVSGGFTETRFYGKESRLLRKSETAFTSGERTITFDRYYDDYQPTDGVLYARKVRMVIAGQVEMLSTVTGIEHGVEIPADRFDLPQEIKVLLAEDVSETAAE